jgi:hypothetical protein
MKRLTLSLLLLAAPALGGDHRVGTTVNLPSGITAVDSPADEECLTYESTGTTGEWQSCGGAGISLTHTGETNPYVSKATGIVKIDADDDGFIDFEFDSVTGYMEFLPTFSGFMAEGAPNNFEMFLDFADATAGVTYTLADQAAGSYTLSALEVAQTWTGVQSFTTPSILGKYDLNNTAVDDDDCTGEQGKGWYDSTDAAWEFCNANTGAPATVAGTAGDVTTVGDCTTGDCFLSGGTGTKLESDTDIIIEVDANNDGTESFQVMDGASNVILELTESGNLSVDGTVTPGPSATPTSAFQDSDMGGTPDTNASIVANCPTGTTAGGDEDCDLAFSTQKAGTLTEAFRIDVTDAGVQTVVFSAAIDTGALTIDSPAKIASATAGTLATNTITLATAAGDYDLPDVCDSATGEWVTLMVRDAAETASLTVLAAEDSINFKGLTLDAGDELDSPGAALDSVTVVCLETDEWYVTGNSGSWTDGGVAD